MGESATAAGAALRESAEANSRQQHLTEESRVLLAALLREEMREAVADGISAAMTDENAQRFMRSMIAEAQRFATMKAGEVAGGVVKALLVRALTFLFLGWLVYALGGWQGLAAMGRFLSGK